MPPLPIAVPSACDSISNVPETLPGRLNLSLQLLESQSHAIRLSIQAKEQGDKETPKTYARQYSAYESWWNASEAAKAAKNRCLVTIPAMPIIPSKVATFLEYRKPGTNGETIPGSSVGKVTISQVISALESYRLNSQHLYKNCPEAQIGLRTDAHIRRFESPKQTSKCRFRSSYTAVAVSGITGTEMSKCQNPKSNLDHPAVRRRTVSLVVGYVLEFEYTFSSILRITL
ncbi:hypothetical protein B0H14DRAFT_2598298 [Mycena olivaceomarginata]|nr:hypothetical protein B0H14DRAFT_2598298 [Mycena olivaceomarginata]